MTSQSFCSRLRSFNRFEIDLATYRFLLFSRPAGTKVVAKGDVVGTSAGESSVLATVN